MKTLSKYLDEKLVINKNYKSPYNCAPTSWLELRKIINDRYDKLGPGTKNMPIDFNDVDVSNIDSFRDNRSYHGIFENSKFEYIDLSNWDVSNVKNMSFMFSCCYHLKSVGDLSNWDVSDVEDMYKMFYGCEQLISVGDLSDWNVSKIINMSNMFYGCEQLKSVGDLSNWNVSKVNYMSNIFKESGITNIPDWYIG